MSIFHKTESEWVLLFQQLFGILILFLPASHHTIITSKQQML